MGVGGGGWGEGGGVYAVNAKFIYYTFRDQYTEGKLPSKPCPTAVLDNGINNNLFVSGNHGSR